MTSSTPVLGAVLALVGWRIYKRIRRNIGRQPLRPRRAMVSVIIFSVLSVVLVLTSLHQPQLLLGVFGGLVPGLALGFVGLRLTRFETTAEGHFYIPNTPIGVALSLLLVGRLAYRSAVLRDVARASSHPPAMQSPLTFLIFGLMAGYYIVYQSGLFLHSRDNHVPGPARMGAGASSQDSTCDRS